MKTVQDIMTHNPLQLATGDTVSDALRLLKKHPNIRHLPVTEDSELIGIVSDRDLRSIVGYLKGLSKGGQTGDVDLHFPIERVMTRGVITVSPDDSIGKVARLFGERKIGALPVVDAGQLIGIVSYIDLINRYVIPILLPEANDDDNDISSEHDGPILVDDFSLI